jgi:phosphate-selective porin OprO/OprP
MDADARSKDLTMKASWKDGVWLSSPDGQFDFHVGGRFYQDVGFVRARALQNDNPNMGQTGPLVLRDGTEMRTLRLTTNGTMYKYVQYKIELDFANDVVVLKDTYLRLIDVPIVGNVQAGHFDEPFSLDELSASVATTFMEKGLPNALIPAYNPGIMVYNGFLGKPKEERMSYALGVFRQESIGDTGAVDGNAVSSEGGYAVTGRLTGLPWYEDKGKRLAHVGVAYSHRDTNDDHYVRYRSRPEAHFIPYRFVDVTVANASEVNLFGAEAATVIGPFSMQSEYIASMVDTNGPKQGTNRSDEDLFFSGFYVQASYFLTGEVRPYKTSTGTFDRIRPLKNFRQDGGWGAFEIATRYSYLDLDDDGYGSASRGELSDWTLGLNWYLNPNVRLMFNYIRSCPDRIDTNNSADIFMTRFQFDF